MGTIVENIREIGIFMIAAQAVMHFAPGKQYEKYIKLIASVMILLMFVNPFVSGAEDIEAEWEAGMEQMIQQLEVYETEQDGQNLWGSTMVKDTAMGQIEEEVRSRLNLTIEDEEYQVAEVEIQLEGSGQTDAGGEAWGQSVECIRIVMEKKKESYEGKSVEDISEPVKIDNITITSGIEEKEETDEEHSYRRLFAKALGIEEDRVEVICSGGW